MSDWNRKKLAAAGAIVLVMTVWAVLLGRKYSQGIPGRDSESQGRAQLTERKLKVAPSEPAESAGLKEENEGLKAQAAQIHSLRARVAELQRQKREAVTTLAPSRWSQAPAPIRAAAERLRELQFERFIAAGQKALTLQPLPVNEEEHGDQMYARTINLLKKSGLAMRVYATDHDGKFPADLDKLKDEPLFTSKMHEDLVAGNFEHNVFADADSKPTLPSIWSSGPDTNGIRVAVMHDGSVQLLREPPGLGNPGVTDFNLQP